MRVGWYRIIIGLGVALGSFGASATAAAAPLGPPLQNPPEIRSKNGSLTFNVTVRPARGTGLPQFSYNDASTGAPSTTPPTLRLLPGDTLFVNLTNKLGKPPKGASFLNDASLHYHGLHVSPNAPSDDSIDMIAFPVAAPGRPATVSYVVKIPSDHPTGLYWYHAHAHGEAERQNLAGMSGALVIDGIAQVVPEVKTLPERIVVVRDAPLPGSELPGGDPQALAAMKQPRAMHGMKPVASPKQTRPSNASNPFVFLDRHFASFLAPAPAPARCNPQSPEPAKKAWTVNGAAQPSIGIRPGEKQFWRLVNAGSDTYLDVRVDNAQLDVVAVDGVPLALAQSSPHVFTVSDWIVPPSSRVEFIVTGPPAGTEAHLRTSCFDAGQSGDPMPEAELATLDPSGSSPSTPPPGTAPATGIAAARRKIARFLTQPPARSQTITYSDQNTINGSAYDATGTPPIYAQAGTVEEWTIENHSSQVHTFHIHQIHFVVEEINGQKQRAQFLQDNVNVPVGADGQIGTVKLRMDFTDPSIIGTFLLHCHILSHEDEGMMAKILVDTAPPITVAPSVLKFDSSGAASKQAVVHGGEPPYTVTGCPGVAHASVSGQSVTVKPAAAGSCQVIVKDHSTLPQSLTVVVAGPAPVITLLPNSLGFAGVAQSEQRTRIQGPQAVSSVTGCAGTAKITLQFPFVFVKPLAVGVCTVKVTDTGGSVATLPVSVNGAAPGDPRDNVTFHHDPLRSGWYRAETLLTPASVASASFQKLAMLTGPDFGKVYAQPLYVTDETVADKSRHNIVIVATATDQVYAFDDRTLDTVWPPRDFRKDKPNVTQQSYLDTNCKDVNPDIGIVSTPVIDRARDRLYLVVPTNEPDGPHLRLHAISLKDGHDVVPAVEVAGTAPGSNGPTKVSPRDNFSRAALLEANGSIYVGLASHCDAHADTTHGWMLSFDADTLEPVANLLNTTLQIQGSGTQYFLGSPWMSGYGPAADAQGYVYFATGNGPFNGTTNFSMSVLKTPGALDPAKIMFFAPQSADNDGGPHKGDEDLGSGGVLLFPDQSSGKFPHLLIQGGKRLQTGNQKFILNRDKLGGQQPGDAGAVWHADIAGPMWGGPAYFQDAAGKQYVVYGGQDRLSTYTLNLTPAISLTTQSFAVSPGTDKCFLCRNQGSQPVVSSNGLKPGTAVVWALKTGGNSGGPITLYAFDALNMSKTVFSGNAGTWLPGPGVDSIAGALVSPLVANGRVYVPTDGGVAVFGLQRPGVVPLGRVVPTAALLSRPLAVPEADAAAVRKAAADAPNAVYGTIVRIQANQIVLRLRNRTLVAVDASRAIASGDYSAPLFVGKVVVAEGVKRPDGSFDAIRVMRSGTLDATTPADR